MAPSRSALLLAALCCVALTGCPKVTELKGQAFELSEGPSGTSARSLALGTDLEEGATIRVETGASVTIEFDDACSATYEAGTHTVSNPCAADDDHDDLDRDDDDDRPREEREPGPEETAARDAAQAIAPPSPALSTTAIVLGSIAGIVAITEAIEDDDAPPPLSP